MAYVNITGTVPTEPNEASDLQLLWQLARTYPDFPAHFVHPSVNNPNYVPPDQGSKIIAVAMATVAVAVVLVICRLWVRLRWSSISFGFDDSMIIPGTLLSVALAVLQVVMVTHGGFGRHVYDVSWPSVVLCVKLVYIHLILYYIALTFIKTSILFFIYRLTSADNKKLRQIIWVFVVFLWLYLIVCCLVTSFECKPAAATYDLIVRIHGAKCMNLPNAMLILNAILVGTDVLLVILPLRLVWQLKVPLRRRIGIIALFSLGIFICVCNVLKMVNIRRAYDSYDFTWSGVDTLLWAGVEAAVAVIVSTIPVLNILFLRVVPRFLGGESTSKNSSAASYTQDTEMMNQRGEKRMQSPVSHEDRTSTETAPQSSYDGRMVFGRELSIGSSPSERPFRSKKKRGKRGKRAVRTPSTLDGAMRNMWLESPGHSDDDADETRSEGGSDVRQSWSPGYQRSYSLPGNRHAIQHRERKMPPLNSRFDSYPRQNVKSMVAIRSGDSSPNLREGPSLWPRFILGKKKDQTPGILKTSEFSLKVNDQTPSDSEAPDEGITRRDEVRITYGTVSDSEEHEREGIYKTSEIRVEHSDAPDLDYGGEGHVHNDRRLVHGHEAIVEVEAPLETDTEPEPSAPLQEGIMKHSEIKLEYSRESDSEATQY